LSTIVSVAVGGLIAAIVAMFLARMYARPIELIRDAACGSAKGISRRD